MTIATSEDREQAGRLVDLAWKEYADRIGQPVQLTPELRQAMIWLAWQACRIEREAQEEIRRLAIEEEREECAKIAYAKSDRVQSTNQLGWGMRSIADSIGTAIRARSDKLTTNSTGNPIKKVR